MINPGVGQLIGIVLFILVVVGLITAIRTVKSHVGRALAHAGDRAGADSP